MINVLFLEAGYGWGGSSAYLFNLLRYIDRKRFNPKVLLYIAEEGPFIRKIRELGIDVKTLKYKSESEKERVDATEVRGKLLCKIINYLRFIIKFIKNDIFAVLKIISVIKQEKIDLVVLNNDIQYHIPGILAAKFANVPCVGRKSGIGGGKKIKRFFSRFIDLFIAVSNAAAQDHLQNGFYCKKMVTVYEGVDLDYLKPSHNNKDLRNKLGILQSQYVIGSISRIDKGKGHYDLIKAADLVIKQLPDVIFLIVGDDIDPFRNLRKMLEDEVKNLGIDNKFIFLGWRNDVLDILQTIDIFVHCPNSFGEALGIATLEALACGKPTVVTNNYGLAETTLDQISGFVVSVGDYVALSEALLRLLKSRELVKSMGYNARIHAEKNFDIKKNTKAVEQIILNHFKE